ncbi:helix-turn-helix domain-containing protein [Mucilaginibacter sp. E4BP6]|uniref:helix-turn-helix domain-containing protein n=1 Tax=Mucilaginibacter sp. E4BP6 TaxID=2723089 RepID=UPI0015CAF456|nr:helix-turn-helix transcriptional regulator [Mucilaginibacter sp. E4BP6]NYE66973.1 transcriptional regulator with XRE-family HTH domain [Mucilaginibacter sp. E4BP6]
MNNRNKEYELAFGKKVKELRLEKKLTQQELATIANVETNQIYRIENGKNGSTLSSIVSVALALGHYPKDLFEFDFNLVLNENFDVSVKEKKKRGPKSK